MSESRLRIETEDERERALAARQNGETCAVCGRALDDSEPVYIERFAVVRSYLEAPVGRECASPELLATKMGTEPEWCVTCGRGVYDGAEHSNRRQAACSQRCRVLASRSRRRRGVE